MIPERRSIGASELEVIRAAIEKAAVEPVDTEVKGAVDRLQVIGRCECGCAGIDFEAPKSEQRPAPLADAIGRTARGGRVGVIVWGRPDAITGLEIYDLGAGDDDLALPAPGSIEPWRHEQSGGRAPALAARVRGQHPNTSATVVKLGRTAGYEALVAATARAIDEADPIGLLAMGAPEDEYWPEIDTIVRRVSSAASSGEVRQILHEEFVRWFDPSIAGPEEAYEVSAQRIWEAVMHYRAG